MVTYLQLMWYETGGKRNEWHASYLHNVHKRKCSCTIVKVMEMYQAGCSPTKDRVLVMIKTLLRLPVCTGLVNMTHVVLYHIH